MILVFLKKEASEKIPIKHWLIIDYMNIQNLMVLNKNA